MYYVYDTTRKNDKGETLVATYERTIDLIAHLEDLCPKIVGKTRAELMGDAADMGYGDDDSHGKAFYSMMEEYINMGIIRKDGQPIKCNIFAAAEYRGSEYGD